MRSRCASLRRRAPGARQRPRARRRRLTLHVLLMQLRDGGSRPSFAQKGVFCALRQPMGSSSNPARPTAHISRAHRRAFAEGIPDKLLLGADCENERGRSKLGASGLAALGQTDAAHEDPTLYLKQLGCERNTASVSVNRLFEPQEARASGNAAQPGRTPGMAWPSVDKVAQRRQVAPASTRWPPSVDKSPQRRQGGPPASTSRPPIVDKVLALTTPPDSNRELREIAVSDGSGCKVAASRDEASRGILLCNKVLPVCDIVTSLYIVSSAMRCCLRRQPCGCRRTRG